MKKVLIMLLASRHPGDIPVDPLKMLIGESACVFPVHFTAEGNIWISRESVYQGKGAKCILELTKLENGWRINMHGIPIRRQASRDNELHRLGWIKLGTGNAVIRESSPWPK